MARYSANQGQQMKRPSDDLTMTRSAFKDAPAYTLLNLSKPLYLTHAGQKQWAVLSVKDYNALITKLEELACG